MFFLEIHNTDRVHWNSLQKVVANCYVFADRNQMLGWHNFFRYSKVDIIYVRLRPDVALLMQIELYTWGPFKCYVTVFQEIGPPPTSLVTLLTLNLRNTFSRKKWQPPPPSALRNTWLAPWCNSICGNRVILRCKNVAIRWHKMWPDITRWDACWQCALWAMSSGPTSLIHLDAILSVLFSNVS